MSTNKVIIINGHRQWSGDVDVGGYFRASAQLFLDF